MDRSAFFLGALLLSACAASQEDEAIRSPSYDYPPQGPTTADGETIGANRRSTSDTLNSGARVGAEGPEGTGWTVRDGQPKFDRRKLKGGNTSTTGSEEEQDE